MFGKLWLSGILLCVSFSGSFAFGASNTVSAGYNIGRFHLGELLRRTKFITLEGEGPVWRTLTNLGVRTGLDVHRKDLWRPVVLNLRFAAAQHHRDSYEGNNFIRLYFHSVPAQSYGLELLSIIYRGNAVYATGFAMDPQKGLPAFRRQMVALQPNSAKSLAAFVHKAAKQAAQHDLGVTYVNFGGD